MKLTADYHTHTIYSHGRSTVEENVIQAMKLGLEKIAITEHGPGHIFYGVSKKKLWKLKEEIEGLKKKYSDQIEILFGLEANLIDFEGSLDITIEEVSEFGFDFLACGYHKGIYPRDLAGKILYSPLKGICKISDALNKKAIRLATDGLIAATYKYKLKFLTHPGAKFSVDMARLADQMNPDTLLEINNKHGHLDLLELKVLKDKKVNFIINSDAHCSEDVGNISNALERLKNSGISIDRVVNIE